MIVIKEGEVCPYKYKCQYSDNCFGAVGRRENTFTCGYVTSNGEILDGKSRSLLDKTGKMEIIIESE